MTTLRSGCDATGGATGDPQAELGRLLLDSTVLIDALRGRRAATQVATLRREEIEPWVCVISVDEVWRAIRPGEESAARRLFRGSVLLPSEKPRA